VLFKFGGKLSLYNHLFFTTFKNLTKNGFFLILYKRFVGLYLLLSFSTLLTIQNYKMSMEHKK